MNIHSFEDIAGLFISYSRSERRGAAVILLLVTAVLFFVLMKREKLPETEYLTRMDFLSDSLRSDYYAHNFQGKASVAQPLPAVERVRAGFTPGLAEMVFIELNGADSAALVSVRGIGAVISRNIIQYRGRLGGFVSLEQLREVYGITGENFEAISKQFFIDSAVIQKIDINFATPGKLGSHPYIGANMAARIVSGREKKGDWSSLRELTDNDILLPGEAERLAPYLVFGSNK